MSSPNPEQFAKLLLWHLTKLQSQLADTKAQLDCVLSELHPEGNSVEFLQDQQKAFELEWKRMYQEACREAGLSEGPPSASDGSGETFPQN